MMMMIAFVTLNSSLVRLIEGLCGSNPVGSSSQYNVTSDSVKCVYEYDFGTYLTDFKIVVNM